MSVGLRISTWRSDRGDTHPHAGLAVDMDWWPMATVLKADGWVVCAQGRGGGSQQALFRAELEPVLARARTSWASTERAGSAAGERLHHFLQTIQAQFETWDRPTWAKQYQASCAALLLAQGQLAIANTGTQLVGRWTGESFELLSAHLPIAGELDPSILPDTLQWMAEVDGSWLGREANPEGLPRWMVSERAAQLGDMFVLGTGLRDAGFGPNALTTALTAAQASHGPLGADERAAEHLAAELVARREATAQAEPGQRWALHSKVSLAVVTVVDKAPLRQPASVSRAL